MKTLGIITARGGSKGIPRKNIRFLGNKPLLEYTAETALASNKLHSVILSTDDLEIAEIGKKSGLEVPFLRPPELANDTARSVDVVLHAINHLEKNGRRFEAICLLQPTNPFRKTETINRCISELIEFNLDTVITVLKIPHEHHPEWAYRKTENGQLSLFSGLSEPPQQRQSLPPAFHREGSVYVTKRDILIKNRSFYGPKLQGIEVNPKESVNLDTLDDWKRAEKMLKKFKAEKI